MFDKPTFELYYKKIKILIFTIICIIMWSDDFPIEKQEN